MNLRFISFPKSDEIAEVELYLGEGRTMDVEIPSNDLSKDYRVPAMQEWVVGESTQGEDGKPVYASNNLKNFTEFKTWSYEYYRTYPYRATQWWLDE